MSRVPDTWNGTGTDMGRPGSPVFPNLPDPCPLQFRTASRSARPLRQRYTVPKPYAIPGISRL